MSQSKFDAKELENSKRIFKSATPKYTIDWYIKLITLSILFISKGNWSNPDLSIFDQSFSLLGTFGWLIVALIWKDRALIILNTAAVIILGSGLISVITNSI